MEKNTIEATAATAQKQNSVRLAESRIAFHKLMATLERADVSGHALAIEIRDP